VEAGTDVKNVAMPRWLVTTCSNQQAQEMAVAIEREDSRGRKYLTMLLLSYSA
jgi:hypothetical protein